MVRGEISREQAESVDCGPVITCGTGYTSPLTHRWKTNNFLLFLEKKILQEHLTTLRTKCQKE